MGFFFVSPSSPEENAARAKRERERQERRTRLNLPQMPPPLMVKGIPVREFRITADFWRGFHLRDSFAIARLFLESTRGEKAVSLQQYMKYARLSVPQMIRLINQALPALTFYHYHRGKSAVHLKLSSIRSDDLKKLLRGSRSSLRGMPDGALVVCEEGRSCIRVGEVVGSIPSVPTSHVSYPNATYRDADYCDIMVNPGEPVVVHGSTPGEAGYPVEFTVRKTPKRFGGARAIYWPIDFALIDGEV